MDFQQGSQDSSMGERIIFSTNGVEATGYLHAKNKIWPLSHTIYKINSKCTIDPNRKAKNMYNS